MAMIVAAPVIRNEPKGPLSPDIGATTAKALPLYGCQIRVFHPFE
jgi:hypothetical protein